LNTEILAIIDQSGSMGTLVADTIGGFNKFVETQKALPGDARLTLVLFDDRYQLQYTAANIHEVPELTRKEYHPEGWTALLDAIGTTLDEQGKRIQREAWADKVIVCITTDGEENKSRKYSRSRVQEMIRRAEQHGWSFVYQGANVDSVAEARNLGINPFNVANLVENYSATGAGVRSSYATMSASVGNLRGGGTAFGGTVPPVNFDAEFSTTGAGSIGGELPKEKH
jgi:hypothetical protein